jgi:hypothetical protein
MRTKVAIVALAVVSAALVTGCSSSGPSTEESTATSIAPDLATFGSDLYGLHFSYPSAWRAQEFPNPGIGSFGGPVVFLSTEDLRDPCTVTADSGGRSIDCAQPLDELPDGGVLATWDQVGVPGDSEPELHRTGERLTVDGHPGWIDVHVPGDCPYGADQTVSARVETDQRLTGDADETLDPEPGHWFQLTVCSRGLDHAQVLAAARAMVDSVTIT